MNYFLLLSVASSFISLKSCYAVSQGKRLFMIEAVRQQNLGIVNWLISQEAFVDVRDDNGATPLMHASSTLNNTEVIKALLEAKANADAKDDDGQTALHKAAEEGEVEAVKLLLGRMEKAKASDSNGRTALHLAVMSGRADMVSFLTENGFDPYESDVHGFNAVHIAAIIGKIEILNFFNDTGMDMDTQNINGTTPLILACLFGQSSAAEYLMGLEVNVNFQDKDGWTALHAAASSGNLDLVRALVQLDAELDRKDSNGQTPLFFAAAKGNLDVAHYLVDSSSNLFETDNCNRTLLHAAAESGNLQLIDIFVGRKLEIDDVNCYGSTPLIVAATEGNEDAVHLLIKFGADTSVMRKLGLPFLSRALDTNSLMVLKCINLIDGEFIPNTIDARGVTSLHYAAKNSVAEVAEYIVELMSLDYLKKAESYFTSFKTFENRSKACFPCYIGVMNTRDAHGKSPLHYAVETGNSDIVDLFLSYGANLSLPDGTGLSSFHTAAYYGQTEVLETLVSHAPDLDEVDKHGRTALFLAAEVGHLDSLKYLIDIGANWTITDKGGWTILHVAAFNGHASVVIELLSDRRLRPQLDVLDMKGRSAAWYAVSEDHFDVLSDLERSGALIIPVPDIYSEIETDSWSFVGYLLNHSDQLLTAKDLYRNGQTVFHLAVAKGYPAVIKGLRKNSCLINGLDDQNRTALWLAVQQEKWDCVEELENLGAEIGPNLSIVEAVKSNQIGFVKYFVKRNVDPNTSDAGGLPALYWASIYGHTDIVKILLESGADVEASHPTALTPSLSAAAHNGQCETVLLLLGKGAEINRVNAYGLTALDSSDESCRRLLLDRGAKHGHELN